MTPTDDQVRIALAQQAAEWFLTNRAGALSPRSRVEFMRWLRTSPVHVEEYLLIANAARDLRSAAGDPALATETLLAEARREDPTTVTQLALPGHRPAGRRASWLRLRLLASGVVALVALAGALLWMRAADQRAADRAEVHETMHGEQRVWRLADGSTLQLNSDSTVRVVFARLERLVEVTRGQAYFQVARDAQRRFRVAVGGASVIAVGTQFDVYRSGGHSLLTVVEGRVGVVRDGGSMSAAPAGTAPAALLVSAGQQVRIDAAGNASTPASVDLRRSEAWRHGQIAFDQRPLAEIAAEFNRYAPIPIEIDDAALRALLVSGTFDAHDAASFLDFLQATDGVKIVRTPQRIVVLRAAGP